MEIMTIYWDGNATNKAKQNVRLQQPQFLRLPSRRRPAVPADGMKTCLTIWWDTFLPVGEDLDELFNKYLVSTCLALHLPSDLEALEHSSIAGGSVISYTHFGKLVILPNASMQPSSGSAIALLFIYLQAMNWMPMPTKDTNKSVHEALFIIVKIGKYAY